MANQSLAWLRRCWNVIRTSIETPIRLFDNRQYQPRVPPRAGEAAGRRFDVAPDGRFLMIKESAQTEGAGNMLVQNWVTKLRRLAPVAK